MADVLQLQENGKKQYLMGHVKAVEDIDTLKAKILWEGSAKQGATLTLSDSVQNYTMLVMVILFNSGYHNSVFFPDDATANCTAVTISTPLSSQLSAIKYMLQKKSDTSYIVSVGRENSGSSTGEGNGVSGTVAKIVGIA